MTGSKNNGKKLSVSSPTSESGKFPKNPFIRKIPEGPFAYPYYSPKGIQLRKELAKYKIFIPTNWGNVLKSLPNTRREYDWAANILPLPCDQRYGMEEMNFMIKTIEKLRKKFRKDVTVKIVSSYKRILYATQIINLRFHG